jgi:transcriptional regulator with XRE-family HTH domain
MDAPAVNQTDRLSRRRATHRPNGGMLGDWIKKRRELQGISQRELADRAGMSRSYLCDIERGRGTKPSVESLDNLSSALGADRTEILRVAGILDPVRDPEESTRERRLVAILRGLSDGNQEGLERYARFLLAEEQHWVQAKLVDGVEEETQTRSSHRGPTLFDTAGL